MDSVITHAQASPQVNDTTGFQGKQSTIELLSL